MTRIPTIAFIALIAATPIFALAGPGDGSGNRDGARNASGITDHNNIDPRWNSNGNWQGGTSAYNTGYAGGCTSCDHMSVGGAGVY